MLKENNFEKIERYIGGIADENEKVQVESLFLNGEDDSVLKHSLENDWNLMLEKDSTSVLNLDHLLDKVHHIIRRNETIKNIRPIQKFISIYMKAAAILLLPLLLTGGMIYFYLGNSVKSFSQESNYTIYAPLGARVNFTLPDGTNGMLNSGSRLSYTIPFIRSRRVKLEGEALFNVIHSEKHPFEIGTGKSTVKVLGTKFNVSAYPSENYVEVVLLQGKVEFIDNNSNNMTTLLPSERLVFENGSITKSLIDPSKYDAWTRGKLVFRGDLMTEVGRRIERWYNVKVELADKELEKYSFRATFEDDKLEEVLTYLSMTSPIRYQITPRRLLDDGTFEKEKVTIYLKK